MAIYIYFLLLLTVQCASQTTTDPPCSNNLTANENVTCTSEATDTSTSVTESSTETATEGDLSSASDEDYDNTTVTSTTELAQNTSQVAVNTTIEPNTTTTTPLPTTPAPVFPERDLEAVPCTCDLTVESCDVGCCCDTDCFPEDRKVFSHCADFRPPFPSDPNLCHRTQWLYRDNLALRSSSNRGGLLCLYKDNLPDRHWLHKLKVVTTLKEFKILEDRSTSIPWPSFGSISQPELKHGQPYKSGDVIWTLQQNKTVQPFALHTTMVTSNCEAEDSILYLRSWSTKCNHILNYFCQPKFGSVNASSFFSGIQILSSPLDPLLNQTEPWVDIKALLCPESSLHPHNCSELLEDLPSITLSETGTECHHSVVKAQYVVRHNGTDGILNVTLYLWLGTVPILQPVHQQLEVVFEWVSTKLPTEHRSGRPGYLQSSPLRSGVLSGEKTNVSPLSLPDSWLSILTSGPTGHCLISRRRPVLFNEDTLSHCKLTVSQLNFTRTGCANLSQNIISLLVGKKTLSGFVVAAYGDSQYGSLTDWVPVIFKDVPSEGKWSEIVTLYENKTEKSTAENDIGFCGGITTSLNLHILWSSVGSYSSPQSKVLGVMVNFGATQTLESCSTDGNTDVKIVTSVSFSDVSSPLQTHFSPLPKYEIRLPRDFFYPLFSSSKTIIIQAEGIHYYFILLSICWFKEVVV